MCSLNEPFISVVSIDCGYVQNINMSSCFFTGLLDGLGRILLSGVARLQIYSHMVAIYAFDGTGAGFDSGLFVLCVVEIIIYKSYVFLYIN